MKESCNHDKVFAEYVLNSDPPKIPWICKDCGVKGTDIFNVNPQKFSYESINRTFN